MIFRRVAFLVAILVGVAATQLPTFVIEYKQRLGGAIDKLAGIIADFDSRSGQHGLSQAAAIDRLRGNADPVAKGEGEQMQRNVRDLAFLREAQAALRNAGPVARLGAFVTHYDPQIANGTLADFEPAVPTSAEALVLGVLGFLVGGGALHVASQPFRRRRPLRQVEPAA